MNVLLMTSPATRNTIFSSQERMPPLGIGFLISAIRHEGHSVHFIDSSIDDSFQLKYLIDKRIDLLGLYLDSICFMEGRQLLTDVQEFRDKKMWNGRIMVGGPHPTARPEDIPEFVDHVVKGEGELAVVDILDGCSERIIQKEPIRDLDSVLPPAWSYFADLPYEYSSDFFPERPVFYHNTSRGCPYRCTFCSNATLWGQTYRTFGAERMVDDVQGLMSDFGVRGVFFREDNFACKKKRTQQFCEILLNKNIDLTWGCETRVDNLDPDLLALMYRAGCRGIFFGVESGSQAVLDELCKGIKLEQIESAFGICRQLGIKTYASFLVGHPSETEKDLLETIKLSRRIRSTNQGFNIFVGLPYSKLYRQLEDEGLYDWIDESGMLYMRGHNFLVEELLGGLPAARIPENEATEPRKGSLFDKEKLSPEERRMVSGFFFQLAGKLLLHGNRVEARRVCMSSLGFYPGNTKSLLLILLTILPRPLFSALRKIQLRYFPYLQN